MNKFLLILLLAFSLISCGDAEKIINQNTKLYDIDKVILVTGTHKGLILNQYSTLDSCLVAKLRNKHLGYTTCLVVFK